VNRPKLRYSDLLPDTIKQFHQENGGVLVELSPKQGKILLSLLDQRDRVERDLLIGTTLLGLLWDNCVWSFYELKARLFHKRLLLLQHYVRAVDASHGWEITGEGNQLFMLFPINQERGKGAPAQAGKK